MIIFNIVSWLKVSGGRGERPKKPPPAARRQKNKKARR
jgi:hypothetical protein